LDKSNHWVLTNRLLSNNKSKKFRKRKQKKSRNRNPTLNKVTKILTCPMANNLRRKQQKMSTQIWTNSKANYKMKLKTRKKKFQKKIGPPCIHDTPTTTH
jgi:hypothetical protein